MKTRDPSGEYQTRSTGPVAKPAKSRSITVVPLTLNFEGKTLLDGVDIQPDEFYRRLPSATTPTRADLSPSDPGSHMRPGRP